MLKLQNWHVNFKLWLRSKVFGLEVGVNLDLASDKEQIPESSSREGEGFSEIENEII